MLSVRISTCHCSSCGRKSFSAKKTASSSKRFMCRWLWGSDHSHEAGMPSNTVPWTRVDASVMTYLCAMASELRCCRGRPRCTNGPKFTPFKGFKSSAKTSAGACVVNCLVWNGALKTKWRPSAPDRGERLTPPLFVKAHSQICYRLTLGENDLTHIHFHIASRTPLMMKQFVYMVGWRVPWLS